MIKVGIAARLTGILCRLATEQLHNGLFRLLLFLTGRRVNIAGRQWTLQGKQRSQATSTGCLWIRRCSVGGWWSRLPPPFQLSLLHPFLMQLTSSLNIKVKL